MEFGIHAWVNTILVVVSLFGAITTVILFMGKLRWESDRMDQEMKEYQCRLESLEKRLTLVNEDGTYSSKYLSERLHKLEGQFEVVTEKLDKLLISMAEMKFSLDQRKAADTAGIRGPTVEW